MIGILCRPVSRSMVVIFTWYVFEVFAPSMLDLWTSAFVTSLRHVCGALVFPRSSGVAGGPLDRERWTM